MHSLDAPNAGNFYQSKDLEMLSLKSKQPTLADLEQAVTDRTRELAEARAAYRSARLAFEDSKARLAEREDQGRQADYDGALVAVHAVSAEIDIATRAVAEAERVLDLAQTMPQRQASAKRIDEAVAALRKAHPASPAKRMGEAPGAVS
jgi:hypothetical protein